MFYTPSQTPPSSLTQQKSDIDPDFWAQVMQDPVINDEYEANVLENVKKNKQANDT